MTATTTLTAPTSRPPTLQSGTPAPVWRTGTTAGIAASVATGAFAALARSIDVPLKVAGSSIPLLGFAEVTFVAAIIGTALAVRLSLTATKVALMLSHVVAAAVVIPALASRLGDRLDLS